MKITPSGEKITYIITTMDGVPLLKEDGTIMTFLNRDSVRKYAKNQTYKQKNRHHTWGFNQKDWHSAYKIYEETGVFPLLYKR